MSCGKTRFSDELGAKLALEGQHKNAHRKPKECKRYYYCKRCRGYHLTSKEYAPKKKEDSTSGKGW